MADLGEIDRALRDLGAARGDVEQLVARYGPKDRSLANVDEALRALGAGVTLVGVGAPSASPRAQTDPQPAASPRARMRSLLDEELDPSEFPQTIPPPAPAAEEPEAARGDQTEDGFELLVDDEDILEIEDDDLQQVDGSDDEG